MMLEADVSLGFVSGDFSRRVPIMAHPPAFISDLSLRDFVDTVVHVTTIGNSPKASH